MPSIIQPAGIPSITIGGMTLTNVDNLILLEGACNAAANGNSTLRIPGATSGYAVTAGKTFRVRAILCQAVTTAGSFELLYADNDVGLASNTAFTNPVRYGPTNSSYAPFLLTVSKNELPVLFSVPATKYICISNTATTAVYSVQVFGYEV